MIFRPGACGQERGMMAGMGVVFDPASLAISAGASLLGGLFSSSAASSAADKQAAAAQRAAESSLAMYTQTRSDLEPYRGYGKTAGDQLTNRLSQLTSPFNPTQASLEATPGYQFTLNQGLRTVQNAAAAKGLGISGSALRGAADYSTGLADSTLKTQFDIDQANKTNSFNKLSSMLQTGQNAAAQTGQFGVQSTANANNYLTSGAAAQAAGEIGSANALSKGLAGVGSAYNTYQIGQNPMLARALYGQNYQTQPGQQGNQSANMSSYKFPPFPWE